jgi:hypothetical protein
MRFTRTAIFLRTVAAGELVGHPGKEILQRVAVLTGGYCVLSGMNQKG